MVVLAIIALGVVSFRNLAVDLFPDIEFPVAVVATNYGEAAPEDVENLVSRPLEAAVSTVEGIETVQSQSQSGTSLVVMMFKNGTNLDQALLDVRESVDQVREMLPDEAQEPNILRFSPDSLPVIWIGLTGEDAAELTELADNQVVPFFERQGGVATVSIEGSKEREIQIELDRANMQQYGVTAQGIIEALNNNNQSNSVGTVDKGNQDLQLRVTGEFTSLDELKETIIPTEAGSTVTVEDVAEIKDDFKPSDSVTLVNGQPSIVLSVMKQTDANTVEMAGNIKGGLDELKSALPEGVGLDVIIDTSEFIEMSIDSVTSNILIGGAISFFILLLFLKSIRATIVIGLSIPIALISTFTLIYFTGQTLNVLTLGGLALGIGMMVDSSIVILENIYSHRRRGFSLFESATKGASELAPAVIASTTTTLVVFLPIVFVDGIASDLFTPLALAVSFSLVASLVVALTLVPMLSSKLLSKEMENNGRRYWFDQLLGKVRHRYGNGLNRVVKYRKTTVFVTLLLLAGSILLVPSIGTELIPATDQGQAQINVETGPGSSLEYTNEIIDGVNERLEKFEDVIEVSYVTVGGDGFMGSASNEGSYTLQMVPPSERDRTTAEIVREIDEELQELPGAEITVNAMDSGMNFGDPIEIQVNGPEHEVLREISEEIVESIASVEGVFNPESAATEGIPQMAISIDTGRAAEYGLDQEQVTGQIQLQFTGQMATQYREEGQEVDVTLYYPEDERSTLNDLINMQIQTPSGAVIPLEEVAELNEVQGPVSLLRENQQPQMNVTTDISGRDLGSVVADIESVMESISLPEGYSYTFGGQAQDMEEAFADLAVALIFSIFLVYAVMAVQFENFLYPFIIMFALPTSIIGVIGGLFITDLALSIPGFIGLIMLAGIVVNNSIILVDYINILRRRGMDRLEAIVEAGRSRLRPILMTTLTTVLAMIPLAIGLGEGAELQQPLAVTIIFGLTVSSIFTLFFVPVIYTLFDDLSSKITKRKKRGTDEGQSES